MCNYIVSTELSVYQYIVFSLLKDWTPGSEWPFYHIVAKRTQFFRLQFCSLDSILKLISGPRRVGSPKMLQQELDLAGNEEDEQRKNTHSTREWLEHRDTHSFGVPTTAFPRLLQLKTEATKHIQTRASVELNYNLLTLKNLYLFSFHTVKRDNTDWKSATLNKTLEVPDNLPLIHVLFKWAWRHQSVVPAT